jgi:hypothetical protein
MLDFHLGGELGLLLLSHEDLLLSVLSHEPRVFDGVVFPKLDEFLLGVGAGDSGDVLAIRLGEPGGFGLLRCLLG